MTGVVDWNDVHASVLRELGEWRRHGWVEQLALALEEVKSQVEQHADTVGEDLPTIVQIKQKLGGLRVYTHANSNAWATEEIQSHVNRIETTCECCGNAADVQLIQFYATTLCSWCYNKELEDRYGGAEASWPDDLELDIAERFPDLVPADCASLRPQVGSGWLILLARYLQIFEAEIARKDLEPGAAQITGVMMDKDGRVDIRFSKSHECLDLLVRKLKLASSATCLKCGHRGDVVRTPSKPGVCSHCAFKSEKEKDV